MTISKTESLIETPLKSVAVIGLGYVGLPLALCLSKVYEVIGFDVDASRIKELKSGVDRTKECSKQQILSRIKIRFSNDKSSLREAKIYIVTVPTPVDDAHRPDLSLLITASQTVGTYLKVGDIVVYESTVFPGATEEVCVPELEKASGLIFNKDFFCGYSPERVNPGDKLNTIERLVKITSGSTSETAAEVSELYARVIDAGTYPVKNIKVAEAAKVIENTQRDLNIAFVNELSIIFDRLGIDTLEVLEAAGSKWNFIPFKPGMVGGHCIGVDPYYLTHKAEAVGYNPQVILAGRSLNDNMARHAAHSIIKRMLQNKIPISQSVLGVLGITFKENCPDIRNSKIVDFVKELMEWGVEPKIVDPWASRGDLEKQCGLKIYSLDELPQLSSLVVAVGHREFRDMTPKQLFSLCSSEQKPVLADLKSLYCKDECASAGFTVFRL